MNPTDTARAKNLALAPLAMAQFVVVLDASIVNVALPSIGRDLDFAQEDLSWVINSYTLFFGGLLLLGGRLADLLGRRRMFIWGMAAQATTGRRPAQSDDGHRRAPGRAWAQRPLPGRTWRLWDYPLPRRRAQQGARGLGRGRPGGAAGVLLGAISPRRSAGSGCCVEHPDRCRRGTAGAPSARGQPRRVQGIVRHRGRRRSPPGWRRSSTRWWTPTMYRARRRPSSWVYISLFSATLSSSSRASRLYR